MCARQNIMGNLFAGIFHIWHMYIWLKNWTQAILPCRESQSLENRECFTASLFLHGMLWPMLWSTCKFHVHRCTPCGVHMFHWTSGLAAAHDGMWLDFDVRSEKNIIGSLFAGIFHIWHTYIWLKWNSSYLAMSCEWKSQVEMKDKWPDFIFQKDLS